MSTGNEIRRFGLGANTISASTEDGLHFFRPGSQFSFFAISPDGMTLAANAADKLHFWEVSTGTSLGHCEGYAKYLAFTPDSKILIAVHQDKVIHWEVPTGKKLREWAHDKNDFNFFYKCAFSPDCQQTLVLGDFDKKNPRIHVWDVAAGKKVLEWKAHQDYVRDLAFSPDGRVLASLSDDESIRLWEMTTGKEIRCWQRQANLYHIAMSPDGRTLAAAGSRGTLWMWDWTTGKELRQLKGAYGPIAFSANGKTVASAGFHDDIRLWHVPLGKESRRR